LGDISVTYDKINQMKNLLVLLLLISASLHAQRAEVLSIANAERAFAQKSVDVSIRAAFLDNFDEKTIAFNNGEPLPGRAGWEQQPEGTGYLFWWPVFADVAASGDWGYTTGPGVFGPDKATKEVKGGLYYSSVWKKNKDGVWKVMIDLGSSTYDQAENLVELKTPVKASTKSGGDHAQATTDLMTFEKAYLEELNKLQRSFIPSKFSSEARIHRPREKPNLNPSASNNEDTARKFAFENVGGDVAPSNDMAFTYGKVKVTVNRNGKEAVIPVGYMHIWKKEGSEWKLVLDVIGQ
jgi:ketosteroid isomerase-like protein